MVAREAVEVTVGTGASVLSGGSVEEGMGVVWFVAASVAVVALVFNTSIVCVLSTGFVDVAEGALVTITVILLAVGMVIASEVGRSPKRLHAAKEVAMIPRMMTDATRLFMIPCLLTRCRDHDGSLNHKNPVPLPIQ